MPLLERHVLSGLLQSLITHLCFEFTNFLKNMKGDLV